MTWLTDRSRRTTLGALVALLALAGATAIAVAAIGRSSAKPPSITKVSPKTVKRLAKVTLTGRRFVVGKRRNTVVFLGRRGKRDDVRVKATVAKSKRKLTFRAPRTRVAKRGRGAVSGKLRLINRNGISRPSKFSVRFDDDGDGWTNEQEIRRGTNPRDPNSPPRQPPKPPTEPLPPPPDPAGAGYTCQTSTTRGPVVAGTGVSSTFEGISNVINEGRARIGHGTYTGPGFKAYCLLRKLRSEPDSDFQGVRESTDPVAGVLDDGQRATKGADYVFRTDVLTTAGHIPGVNTVEARAAGSVFNVNGWAELDQSCDTCAATTVSNGALRSTVKGTGSAGPDVGAVSVYERRVSLGYRPGILQPERRGTEVSTRVLLPLSPTDPGSSIAARMNLSAQHPANVRNDGTGTVGDVFDSGQSWVTAELRVDSDGTPWVAVRESGSGAGGHLVAQTKLNAANLHNVFLTLQLTGPSRYEVRYKANTDAGDVKVDLDPAGGVTDRALPAGMQSVWLSLDADLSRSESAANTVAFDRVDAVWQPDDVDVPQETFGDVAGNIQVPPGFHEHLVSGPLPSPTSMDLADNGDIYIALREGKVMRLPASAAEGGANVGSLEQVLDISSVVGAGPFDQGLTAIVLDPAFADNGYFYVYYTVDNGDEDTNPRTVSRVERFKVGPGGTANPADPDRKVLVGSEGPAPTGNTCPSSTTSDCLPSDAYTHSSGGLAFGANPGHLWVSVPDGADPDGAGDPLALRAIDPNSLSGKILRIDPSTGAGIPGNPNYPAGSPSSPQSRTWAMGFRNPFRITERPGVGSVFVTDVGWGNWEEVDRISGTATPGLVPNFGWPCYEGTPASSFKADYPTECAFTGVNPLHEYDSAALDHAAIGSTFYTGSAYPAPWRPAAGNGSFYYGDYPTGEITLVSVGPADQKLDVQRFAGGFTYPVQLIEGPVDRSQPGGDKALYLLDFGPFDEVAGRIWRITYDGP